MRIGVSSNPFAFITFFEDKEPSEKVKADLLQDGRAGNVALIVACVCEFRMRYLDSASLFPSLMESRTLYWYIFKCPSRVPIARELTILE